MSAPLDPEEPVQIAVRVPRDLHAETKAAAAAAGMTLREFVNAALEEHLTRQGGKRRLWAVAPRNKK